MPFHPSFTLTLQLTANVKALNSLPDDKISDWSKWKQIAYNILKCIENGK